MLQAEGGEIDCSDAKIHENLSSHSEWFKKLTQYDGCNSPILLRDVEYDTFSKLIETIHPSFVNNAYMPYNDEEIMDMLHLANMLLFPFVEEKCATQLWKNIPENYNHVFNHLAILSYNNNDKLEEDALFILKMNLTQLLMDEKAYYDWGYYAWRKLLQEDTLPVSEITLFTALLKWSKFHEIAPANLADLASLIRYEHISEQDLEHIVFPSGLLSSKIIPYPTLIQSSNISKPRKFSLGIDDGIDF